MEVPSIPQWIAKTSVPETKETTKQLLIAWAKLLQEEEPSVTLDLEEKTFLGHACKIANELEKKLHEKYPKYKPSNFGIWVGFPETPIGRLNADLASRVYFTHHWLTQKNK